jgi:hypothetical protein
MFLVVVHSPLVLGQSWIPDNFPTLNWQPTIAPPGARYSGNQSCAHCHAVETRSYLATPMGHALEFPEESSVLGAKRTLTFRNGPFIYAIVKTGSGYTFTVTDGNRSISAPIRWAVGYGIGGVGQTFVLEYGGLFYESRVSYYAETGALDITMGHAQRPPTLLEEAMGNWMDETALTACLRCHATAATSGNRLQLGQMTPGIGCEGCHGPGANHIETVQSGKSKDLHIFNPGHLPPGRITDFCGACHRTTAQEKLLNVHGVENARFQGYRLERSRCYDPADLRISCIACHNPHQTIARNVSFYDAKCLACHGANSGRGHPCSVGKQDCITCHMPRVSVPRAHTTFTDHWIRVARPNAPYPD